LSVCLSVCLSLCLSVCSPNIHSFPRHPLEVPNNDKICPQLISFDANVTLPQNVSLFLFSENLSIGRAPVFCSGDRRNLLVRVTQ
jgi:hypothetical protein